MKEPKTIWKKLWRHWVAPTSLPGVWKRQKGGYIVRARINDQMTGRKLEIRKVLDVQTEREAFNVLEDEKLRVRAAMGAESMQMPHFGDYAVDLKARKIQTRDLRSAATQDKWHHTLTHLIGGTEDEEGNLLVPGFGELRLDEIRSAHIERWKAAVCELIAEGVYKPTTANGWLSIMCVIMRTAKREFELSRDPTEHVRKFDTSDHVTYTEEAPQSLRSEQVPEFLELMRGMFPQHYAMTYLGFCTGLRPSSLRPLRRRGDQPDIVWSERRLLVRRSQTRRETVLQSSKQRTRYSITLPPEVINVLRWHSEEQLQGAQKDSDLLFPSLSGGFRSPCVLTKPFAEISDLMGLGYHFTQVGMRRTFNDLARAANVEALVTRSISGHATERMQHHYSTVQGEEQAASMAKVVDIMTGKERNAS